MRASIEHTGHTAAIYTLAPAPDGALISAGGDGTLLAWNPAIPEEVRLLARFPAPVYSVLASVEGLLFAGTAEGELFVLDPGSKRVLNRIRAHTKGIFSITSLGDDRLACAGGDGSLSIWKLSAVDDRRCELLRTIPLCEAKLRGLAHSPQHDLLAVACGDGFVRVLDTLLFNEVATCEGHSGGANTVIFLPSRSVLVSGGKDGHLRIWDASTGYREMLSIAAHRSTVYQLIGDANGERFLSVSRDRTAKLWNADTFAPLYRLDAQHGGHSHSVNAACWMNESLFTAGDDRKVLRWSET